MNFRILFILLALIVANSSLEASPSESFPIGVVIRKGVLNKLVKLVNSTKAPFELAYCMSEVPEMGKWSVKLRYSVALEGADWIPWNSEALLLSTQLTSISAEGFIYTGCSYNSLGDLVPEEAQKFASFNIKKNPEVKSIPLTVWFDPHSFIAKADYKSILDAVKGVEIVIDSLPVFTQAVNQDMMKSSILTWISEMGGQAFGSWLQRQLRGLSYVENLEDLLSDYRGKKEVLRFEKGPLKMERVLDELNLAFAVYPRQNESLFLNGSGIEFYFNALLLNDRDMNQMNLTGLSLQQGPFAFQVSSLRNWLANGGRPHEPNFDRPEFPESKADFSMFLTEDLVNHTMDRMYRADLLSFKTTLDMGTSTRDLIAKDLADVKVRLDLGSRTPPKMKFEADRLNLHVADYTLSLGTEIEDRIIPATHVQTSVDLAADLTFDSESKKISLVMEPESFSIELKESNGKRQHKLRSGDITLLENVAENFWQKYFANYPKLTLFRPVFELENASIRPVDLKVRDGLILMDFDLQTLTLQNTNAGERK